MMAVPTTRPAGIRLESETSLAAAMRADRFGVLVPSVAQEMVLAMNPGSLFKVHNVTENRHLFANYVEYRFKSGVYDVEYETLQEETRKVTVTDDPSSPTLKITYSQG